MLFQSHKLFAFQLSQIECAQLLTVLSTNHSFAHTSVTAQLLWTLLNSFHFVGLDSSLLIVLETDLFNFNSLFLIYLLFSTSWENLSTNWFGCVTSHLFILFNVAEWPNPVNFRVLFCSGCHVCVVFRWMMVGPGCARAGAGSFPRFHGGMEALPVLLQTHMGLSWGFQGCPCAPNHCITFQVLLEIFLVLTHWSSCQWFPLVQECASDIPSVMGMLKIPPDGESCSDR